MAKSLNRIRLTRQKVPTEKSTLSEDADIRRRHRFIATIMIFVILLFMIPTYQLVASYNNLQEKKATITQLEKDKATLASQTKAEETLASQLNDTAFVEKYARAKYYYSKSGESIYPVPSLLP